VAAWDKYDDRSDPEAVNTALDELTVAHLEATFELDRRRPSDWEDREDRAIERLIAAWEKYSGAEEDPKAEQALNLALDELAVAHAAANFEWAT
jgi:hypothetical protein